MADLFKTTKTTVTVVGREASEDAIYIGRKAPRYPQSCFHNPFKIGFDGDRKDVLLKFAEYWYAPEQKTLRTFAIQELAGKTLVCWCHPMDCHGDLIAAYVNWKVAKPE